MKIVHIQRENLFVKQNRTTGRRLADVSLIGKLTFRIIKSNRVGLFVICYVITLTGNDRHISV